MIHSVQIGPILLKAMMKLELGSPEILGLLGGSDSGLKRSDSGEKLDQYLVFQRKVIDSLC